MNDTPGTLETVGLLSNLRETIGQFAKREEKLLHDLTAKRNSVERELREATEAAERQHRLQRAESEGYFNDELERNESWFERRTARIARAYPNSKRQQRARADAHKGEGLSAAQMGRYRADKTLEEGLAATAEAYAGATGLAEAEERALAAVRGGAKRLFLGYGSQLRALRSSAPGRAGGQDTPGASGAGGLPEDLVAQAGAARREAAGHLGTYRSIFPTSLFRFFPVPVLAVAGWGIYRWLAGAGSPAAGGPSWLPAAGGVGAFVVLLVLHQLCRKAGAPAATDAAGALARARSLLDSARASATRRQEEDSAALEAAHAATCAELDQRWSQAVEGAVVESGQGGEKVEEQVVRVREKSVELHAKRRAFLESERPVALAGIDAERDAALEAAREQNTRAAGVIDRAETAAWEELTAGWAAKTSEIYRRIALAEKQVGIELPEWSREAFENWSPPAEFAPAVRYGSVAVDAAKLVGKLPGDPRLALPGPAVFSLPLAFGVPDDGSLLIETDSAAAGPVAGTLNALVLRLMASAPPGKIAFTIIDPVGLGENFAGVMHLADHEESLISGKIWTAANHIEERLAELNERIEKIIQRYLRDEYATIADYNRQAGAIAEKYHFLVVADFPSGFSDAAVRRLQSIATSGARCGVHALVHWDRRQAVPQDAAADALRAAGVVLKGEKGAFQVAGAPAAEVTVTLDPPPPHEDASAFYHRAGRAHVDADRVEVPFSDIVPAAGDYWTGDAASELRVPLGRTGATKLQELALGKDTRQHALIAGKTGSGKSTLFHVIVTNLALRYSPDEIEFYLVDFKKGVEFKAYASAKLPHARVVAIESDREFGLSVLQKLDDELRRRGDLFRQLGVQDVAGYRRASGTGPLPRTLLIIDEFQEYFVEDDRVAQGAAVLLDRIVRQGRAFGIHVLLGSQTLGGAYTLARATLGQMVVRIALQCNEADAYLIMDENNPAPRLLTRPGEGIYNDAAGAIESNSPFQVCWLPEEVRDHYLGEVAGKLAASGGGFPPPFVFEGNAPADVRENGALAEALAAGPAGVPASASAWLGAPNAIKGPTAAVFRRQSGNHLLVVGQREESALAMFGVSMLGLAAQFPAGAAKFYLFDSSAPDSPERRFLESVCAAVPGGVTVVRNHDLDSAMAEVTADMNARTGDEKPADAPATFLFVSGLQHFKKLKQGDDFSFSLDEAAGPDPSAQFGEVATGGSSVGVHIVATVDTYGNITRFLGRKALAEFEMRVVFQMGANDSASLIDSPAAGSLGLHRALFYHEGEGYLETFRPYALPDPSWIESAGGQLRTRS